MNRKRRVFVAIAVLLLFATSTGAAQWNAETMEHPTEGTAHLVSQPFTSEYRGKNMGRTGFLGAQCKNGKLDVILNSGLPFTDFKARITHRVDNAAAETTIWTLGSTGDVNYVSYPGDDERLFRQMMKGKEMVLRMRRMQVGTETLTVSLMGFTKASQTIREACGI